MSTTTISLGKSSGFPELRYLLYSGKFWDDSDLNAFRYCCANSPKLEEIRLYCSFEPELTRDIYALVANSIG